MKKLLHWLWILTGLLPLLLGGCNPEAEKPKKQIPVPAVELQTLEASDFVQFLSLTATVEPRVTAILSSPAEGPVVKAEIREGDAVVTGQELFRIGRRDYADAALASANAELKRQSEDFRRTEQLVQKGEASDSHRARTRRARGRNRGVASGRGGGRPRFRENQRSLPGQSRPSRRRGRRKKPLSLEPCCASARG
ncbi:MAG: hypothetical protein WEB60_13190 [Terrimicrobiaceae bacterium]